MKMVAAAKMVQDIQRLHRGKHFGVNVVSTVMENDGYLQRKKTDVSGKGLMIVAITGDKGLCGSVNSSIVRYIKAYLENNGRDNTSVFAVGEKGAIGLGRICPELMTKVITETRRPMNFWTAASMGNMIVNHDKNCGNIMIVYNWFKNSMTFVVKTVYMLPPAVFMEQYKSMVKYESEEPETGYQTPYYYELYSASMFYNVMINFVACEQASKMNAMGAATKNAGDQLDQITLQYNKARQAKITMELIEIISGSNAV